MNTDGKIVSYAKGTETGRTFVKPFLARFGGSFGMDEPSGFAMYYCEKGCFNIPDWETIDGFQHAVQDSLQAGKDLLIERYRGHEVSYQADAIY